MSFFRFLVAIFVVFFPMRVKCFFYRNVLGYDVSVKSKVGFTFIFVEKCVIGDNVVIGHFNIIKSVESVIFCDNSILGNFNWISGYIKNDVFFESEKGRQSFFEMKEHSAITNRHLIDCTNKVVVGKYSTIAGYRSQILSHSINISIGKQVSNPVLIGDYCFVGTSCIILPGVCVSDKIVVGAGSIVNKSLLNPCSLYAGNPAVFIKTLGEDEKYFTRSEGVVY